MDRIKVDFLKAKYGLEAPRERGVSLFARLFLVILITGAVTAAAFSFGVTSSETGPGGFFGTLSRLVLSGDKPIAGEDDDRINILLTGVGGKGHEGSELTDTMIFTSFRPSTSEVGMLSIPRDMAVPIPDRGIGRINSVNAYEGPETTATVVGEILEQPIHYWVKVNFNGFADFIEALDGVDVYVENTFTDPAYPTPGMEYADCGTTTTVLNEEGEETEVPTYGCRYEVLSFQEGWTHMDGTTALKFVRSRHGNNGEGSDFARAARQQKVLLAVREKLLSVSTLFNPGRITGLFSALGNNVETNLTGWEITKLATYIPTIDQDAISHHVLDESGPLYSAIVNGAYLLLPDNNDWGPIQRIAANVFQGEGSNIAMTEPDEDVPNFVRVEIQNGTDVSGMAFNASQILSAQGFDVIKIGNAVNRDYSQTVIYDLTDGTEPEALQALSEILAGQVSMSAAGWVYTNKIIPSELTVSDEDPSAQPTESVDFLVILGANTANLVMR